MGKWGQLNVNAFQQDYWDVYKYERIIDYSNPSGRSMYPLNYSQTSTPGRDTDRQTSLSVSRPVDDWMFIAKYNINQSSHDPTSPQESRLVLYRAQSVAPDIHITDFYATSIAPAGNTLYLNSFRTTEGVGIQILKASPLLLSPLRRLR